MFNKKDLKTGMFGVMSDGDKFVIVGDVIVYQGGGFDFVSKLNDDLANDTDQIDILIDNCRSFKQVRDIIANPDYDNFAGIKCVYDRRKEAPTEMTVAEIEKALNIKNLKIIDERK